MSSSCFGLHALTEPEVTVRSTGSANSNASNNFRILSSYCMAYRFSLVRDMILEFEDLPETNALKIVIYSGV
jgi:hypothetical protein